MQIDTTTLFLTSPASWRNWYNIVRIKAESEGVWDYIDPTVEPGKQKEHKAPDKPRLPALAEGVARHTQDQLDDHDWAKDKYKLDAKDFHSSTKALAIV